MKKVMAVALSLSMAMMSIISVISVRETDRKNTKPMPPVVKDLSGLEK